MRAKFATLLPGDPLAVAGYAIRARLGSGGMGNVFLSFTPGGRAVAIKVIRPELASDLEFRRRFKQEVTAAQRVQGLYTAPVIDADPDAEQPWLATAYIPGPSLEHAVAEHGPFPLPTVFRLLGGTAEGLQVIHASGLIHRDLKPSNVLLAEDGPRVIDFGIAYAADVSALTSTGAIIGTPAFMAPEQVRGAPVTAATDIFALGHLAIYAATGHTAFGEGHQAALVYRIAEQAPDLDNCPEALRDIAERCMAKDPVQRPPLTELIHLARAQNAGHTVQLATSSWLPPAVAGALRSYDTDFAPAPAVPVTHMARVPGPPPLPESLPSAGAATTRFHRWLPTAAAGAVIAVALLALTLHNLFGNTGNSPAAGAGPSSSPSRAAHVDARRAPAPGPSGSPAATSLPGGYLPEYSNVSFTMPGGNCASAFPSEVTFTAQGPQVATTGVGVNLQTTADLTIECNDPYAGGNTDIQLNSAEVAPTVGDPGAAGCYTAVQRDPQTGPILFRQLRVGMQFCIAGYQPSSTGQLARITLTAKSGTTYDLTWQATGWSIPSNS